MDNKIIVIVGFSSSGKDSIAKYLNDNYDYNFITSVTNRPMRPEESEGDPYNFITYKDFILLIDNDDLIEYRTYDTEFGTWFYGVKRCDVLPNQKYVVVLDLWGLDEFKKHFGDRIQAFFIQVDNETREERAKLRGGFNQIEWDRRLKDDNRIFNQGDISEQVDFIVPNYDFRECVSDIVRKLYPLHVDKMEG